MDYLLISDAAKRLGVSIDTVRRWDKRGVLKSERLDGKNRYFSVEDLDKLKANQPLSMAQTSHKLKISIHTLRRLENSGLIKGERNSHGDRVFSMEEINRYQRSKSQAPNSKQILNPKPQTNEQNGSRLRSNNNNGVIPNSFQDPILEKTEVPHLYDRTNVVTVEKKDTNKENNVILVSERSERNQILESPPKADPQNDEFSTDQYNGSHPPLRQFFAFLMAFIITGFSFFSYQAYKDYKSYKTVEPNGKRTRNIAENIGQSVRNVPSVLAASTKTLKGTFNVNLPSIFNDIVTFNRNIKAPNVLYSLTTSGTGLSLTTGQTPVITNTGVTSLQSQTGALTLTSGTGITISGLTITNSDLGTSQKIFKTIKVGDTTFDAGSNTDTVTFAAGTNVSISTDTSNKKLTFSSTNPSGFTDDGTIVRLTTSTDSFGIGTAAPLGKLGILGNLAVGATYGAFAPPTSGLIVEGNVGIGTSNPTSTLHLVGASTFTGNTTITGTSTLTGTTNLSGAVVLGSSTSDTLTFTGRVNSDIVPSVNNTYSLGSGSLAWSKLYLSGIAAVGGQATFTASPVGTGVGDGALYINPSSVADTSYTVFGVAVAGTEKLRMSADGNITIQGNLMGPSGGSIGYWSRSGTMVYPALPNDTIATLGNVGVGTTSPVSLFDVNSKFNVLSGGNVGIGTTSPGYKFDLEGTSTGSMSPLQYIKDTSATTTTGALTTYATGDDANQRLLVGVMGPSYNGYQSALVADRGVLYSAAAASGISLVADGGNINFATGGAGSPAEKMRIDINGNVGIGTTNPIGRFDVTDTSNTAASLNLTNNTATTIGNGANTLGVLDLQSTSLTTGNFMNIELNALSSGKGINLTSTSTALSTGNLFNLDWSPSGSTTIYATGDLLSLNVGQYGSIGNFLNIKDNGSSVFSVSQTQITNGLPASFTAPGDVSVAYDINFTNPTLSMIKSQAPLTLQAGESFNSSDLSLNTYNTGSVVINQDNQPTAAGTSYALQILPALTSSTNSLTYTSLYSSYNIPTVNLTGTSGTVTSVYNSYQGLTATAGTVTNWYGLYLAAPTGSGTVTNKYAFVSESGAGNVGINTTAPASPLSITAPTTFTIGTLSQVTAPAATLTGALTGLNINISGTTPGTQSLSALSTTAFTGGGNETTNYGLNIGAVTGSGTSTNYGGYIGTVSGGSTNNMGLRITGTAAAAANYGLYVDAAAQNYFAGNVGIGTTGPVTLLDVNSKFNVLSGGNVGINTVTPAAKLDIKASGFQTGSALMVRESSAGSPRFQVQDKGWVSIGTSGGTVPLYVYNDGTSTVKIYNASDFVGQHSDLILQTANGPQFTIQALRGSPNVGLLDVAGSTSVIALQTSGGNVGIGTTNPIGRFDVTDTSNTAASLNLTNNTATTIGNGANTLGVLDLQSTSLTTGNFMNIELNALSSGKGINLTSTSTALSSGNLFNLDWSPTGSTNIYATGDLFSVGTGNAYAYVGNLLNVKSQGSSVFSVSDTTVTSALPASFTASGDVSIANDLNFTDSTASFVKSNAPLYLQAGKIYDSSDLTLRTFNAGNIVFDSGNVGIAQDQAWTLPTSTTALNISSGLLDFDTTNSRIGIGTTAPLGKLGILGNAAIGATFGAFAPPTSGLIVEGNVGIGTSNPSSLLDVNSKLNVLSGGNVGIGTTSPAGILELKSGSTLLFKFTTDSDLFFGGGNNRILDSTSTSSVQLGGSGMTLKTHSGGAMQFKLGDTEVLGLYAYGNNNVILTSYDAGRIGLAVKAKSGQTADLQQWQNSAGTPLVVISAGGNLGIGTTSPLAKLALSLTDATPTGLGFLAQNSGETELITNAVDRNFSGAGNWTGTNWAIASEKLQHTAGETVDAVLANANLTASTILSSRSYTIIFTVSGRTAGSITPKIGAAAGTSVSTDTTSTQTIIAAANDANLIFTPSSDFDGSIDDISVKRVINNIAILNNGDVGIGTTSPQFMLDVFGGPAIRARGNGGNVPVFPTGASAGKGIEMFYTDWSGVDQGYLMSYDRVNSAYKPLLLEGSSLLLQTTSGGNVGIGTTAPLSLLDVNQKFNVFSSGNVGIGNTSPTGIFEVGAGNIFVDSVTGNVGIGTTAPGGYKINIAGTGYLNDTAWNYTSDIRLKDNIASISGTLSLDLISHLNPVTFDYLNGNTNRVGFIAQQVQDYFPYLVSDRGDGYLTLKTDELLPYTISALQELSLKVASMSAGSIVGAGSSRPIGATGSVTPDPYNSTQSALLGNVGAQRDAPSFQTEFNMLKARVDFLEAKVGTSSAEIVGAGSSRPQTGSENLTPTDIASTSAMLNIPSDLKIDNNVTITNDLTVTGKSNFYDVGITGNLTVGLLVINGLDVGVGSSDPATGANTAPLQSGVSISTLSGPLRLQSNSLGNIEMMGGKITIDQKGNLTVPSVAAAEYKAVAGKSVGTATIEAGTKSIEIQTPLVKNSSRIMITLTTGVNTVLAVTEKKVSSSSASFVVGSPDPVKQDTSFDWFLVNESN